jgi:hypothetical protein
MGTDVFLFTKLAGANSSQRACSQATQYLAIRHLKIDVYGKRQIASEVFDITTLL